MWYTIFHVKKCNIKSLNRLLSISRKVGRPGHLIIWELTSRVCTSEMLKHCEAEGARRGVEGKQVMKKDQGVEKWRYRGKKWRLPHSHTTACSKICEAQNGKRQVRWYYQNLFYFVCPTCKRSEITCKKKLHYRSLVGRVHVTCTEAASFPLALTPFPVISRSCSINKAMKDQNNTL